MELLEDFLERIAGGYHIPVKNSREFPGMKECRVLRRNCWRISWEVLVEKTRMELLEGSPAKITGGFLSRDFWRILENSWENSLMSFFGGLSRNSLWWLPKEFLQGIPLEVWKEFFLGIPLELSSADFSRSSLWEFLKGFPWEIPSGALSRDFPSMISEDSSRGSVWVFLKDFPRGIPPGVPS